MVTISEIFVLNLMIIKRQMKRLYIYAIAGFVRKKQ